LPERLDWVQLYSIIQRSPFNDGIFSWSQIKRLPIQFTIKMAEAAHEQYTIQTNLESYSNAALGVMVARALGNTKLEQTDLLPLSPDPNSKIKPKTKQILQKYRQDGKLPHWVFQAIFAFWDMTEKE